MSTVKTNNVQVGTSGTATNNFTWYQPATPDGTVRLGVGNTGATTADVVTANSSGNVGIGTTSPGAKLQVSGNAIATNLAFGATTAAAGTIGADTGFSSTTPRIVFYGSTSGGAGQLELYSGNAPMVFSTSNTERLRISSSGTATFSGNLSTASRGISAGSVPSGSVIQVVSNVVLSNYTGTSSTNVDYPAWSFTFTPQYATSKVFILISVGVNYICDGVTYLKRNGTIVKDTWFGSSRQDDQYDYPQAAAFYLDSPGTTSTITYQVGGRAGGCGNTIRFGGSDNHASFTMMEIAA